MQQVQGTWSGARSAEGSTGKGHMVLGGAQVKGHVVLEGAQRKGHTEQDEYRERTWGKGVHGEGGA